MSDTNATHDALSDWNDADDGYLAAKAQRTEYQSLIFALHRNAVYHHNFFTRYFQEGPDDHDCEPRQPTLADIEEFNRLSAAVAVHHRKMGIDDDAIMRDPDPSWKMRDIDEYKAQYALEHHPRFLALVDFLTTGKLPDGRYWQEGTPDDLWAFWATDAGTEFKLLVNALGDALCHRLVLKAALKVVD